MTPVPVVHLVEAYGLFLLFLLVALESAGAPVPGETGLIAACVLASQGYLDIVSVITAASGGAIVGDNVGYWIGRLGGRRLLERWPASGRYLGHVVPRAEAFFARHGGKAVFFARFITVLRIAGAWVAGVAGMPWWRFLAWNVAGGVAWATGMGLATYYAGQAATEALSQYGMIGATMLAALALMFGGLHLFRRRSRELRWADRPRTP
jgi:membrane protein DedA with SNARE-associated domain